MTTSIVTNVGLGITQCPSQVAYFQPIESTSSPARSMCALDCARFLTHHPDHLSQTCKPDCEDGCDSTVCGSDGSCVPETLTTCLPWSFELPDGTCSEFGCPDGFFRDASTKTCQKCDPSCAQCAGPELDQCLNCESSSYLKLNPASSSEGTCSPKEDLTSRFTLIVSNSLLVIEEPKSPENRDGSLNNPFIDLRDALTRADELAAPLVGSSVQILLTRGDHFLLLEPDNARYYIPPGSDKSLRDYSLTIKPLPCSYAPNIGHVCVEEDEAGDQLVRVLSKMDAYYSLQAPLSLTIEDITFDFSDSLLPWNSYCHNRRSQTCQVSTDANQTISVVSADPDCSCRTEPLRGEYCSYNHPLAFIQPPRNTSASINLTRCHFQHIYAPFNSLVGLTTETALTLTVTDSVFQDISMCGAIFNSQSESPTSEALQDLFINPMKQSAFNSSILIEGSTFRRLGLFLVFPDFHSLRKRAYSSTHFDALSPVLTLKAFPAQVTLRSNHFNQCKFLYPQLMNVILTGADSPILDSSLTLSKTGLLAQGLLIIRDHSLGLSLIGNVFEDSTSLRGAVIVEVSPDYQKGVFIFRNTFQRLFSAYTSPALNLKSAWRESTPSSCSGFHIEANYYGRILLSPNGQALLSLACLFPHFGQSDTVNDITGSEFLAYPQTAKGREQPLPPPLPFSYTVPGETEQIQADFRQTVLRDNVMGECLRFKGQGQLLSVLFMRNVLIDGLSILRAGDFSLSEEYQSPALFWKEFGAINWSQADQAPLFESAVVSEGANVGDAPLLLGGVANLLVKGVFVLENWYWQTDPALQHLLIIQESERKLQDLEVVSLIEGHLRSLIGFLMSPHSPYVLEAVLQPDQNESVLNGALIRSQSLVWEGGRLQDSRTSDHIINIPLDSQEYHLVNITLRDVSAFSILNYKIGTFLSLEGVSFFNFEFFYGLDSDNFAISDSLFDNTGLMHKELAMRFLIIWEAFDVRTIQRSTFINPCGGGCLESFEASYSTGSLIRFKDCLIRGFNAFQGSNFLLLILGDAEIINTVFEGTNTPNGEPMKASGNSIIRVSNSTFRNNTALTGGVFSIFSQSTLEVENSVFEENKALSSGGVISAYTSGTLSITNCTFQSNSALSASVISGIGKQKELPWVIKNSKFKANRGLGTLKLQNVAIEMDQIEWEGNEDLQDAPSPIILLSSHFLLSNSSFTNELYPNLKCPQSSSQSGGFLYDLAENEITVENSHFSHVCAYHGGAFYLRGFSDIEVKNSTFTQCNSVGYGGAIFGSNHRKWSISSTRFIQNSAGIGGSDLFVQDSTSSLTLSHSEFTRSSGNFAILSVRASLNISLTDFKDIRQASEGSSIISCRECGHLILIDSHLQDIISTSAISIIGSSQVSTLPFLIKGNTFERMEGSQKGGAILMDDSHDLIVEANTFKEIRLTTPDSKGAALYLTKTSQDQRVEVKHNRFQNCEAASAAALFWEYKAPVLNDNQFIDNSVTIYGQDAGSYPVKIAFIDAQTGYRLYSQDPFPVIVEGERERSVLEVRSGSTLPELYIAALDQHNQVVTHIHGDIVYTRVTQLLQPGASPSEFPPTLRIETIGEWRNGVFKFQGASFTGDPGQSYQVAISSNHIDSSRPDTQAYLSAQGLQASISIHVKLRNCESGEGFLSDGRCEQCSPLTYLLEPPSTPQECLACPPHAECFGGTRIAPQRGYWRSGSDSLDFVQCFNSAACAGSQDDDSFNPSGSCSTGYFGTLCASCNTGYTRNSLYQCSQCPDEGANIAIIVILILVFSGVFIAIIKLSLKAVGKRKSLFTVYFKILINHFQVLMLISSFDLDWPSEVQAFLDTSKTVADGPTVVFSFDCFMDTSIGKPLERFYLYLMTYFLLPGLIALFAFLFWRLKYFHNTGKMCVRLIQTLLIVFFLIHPSITQIFLQSFDCVSIDSSSYLKEQLSEECWVGDHLRFAMSVGLLGIIFWSIGIPVLSFYLLYRKRNHLNTSALKEKLGFLYNGYSPRAYYWESSITLRKLVIAFVSIFLTVKGTMLQSLVLFVILFSSILLTIKIRPYEDFRVNRLEVVSLFALLVTAYCGIFFLSSRNPSNPDFVSGKDLDLSAGQRWLLFLCLVCSNLAFFLMWMWRIGVESHSTLIRKAPKCFTKFCLCGDKQKFDRQSLLIKKRQVNSSKTKLIQEIIDLLVSYKTHYEQGKDFQQMETFEDQTFKYRQFLQRFEEQDEHKGSRDSIALSQLFDLKKSQGNSLLLKALKGNRERVGQPGDTSLESMPSTRRDLMSRCGDIPSPKLPNNYVSRQSHSPRIVSGFSTSRGERISQRPTPRAWQAFGRQISGQQYPGTHGDAQTTFDMPEEEGNPPNESGNMQLEDLCEEAEQKETSQNQLESGLERGQRIQFKKLGTFDRLVNELEDDLGPIRNRENGGGERVATQVAVPRSDLLREGLQTVYGTPFYTQMGEN